MRTFAVSDPVAIALGAEPLKQEESQSASLGLVLQPAEDLYITIDGYGFTGMETSRLGFDPAPTTVTLVGGCINFTVVMKSVNHGTCTSVGAFNLLNTEFTGTLTWVVDGVTYKYTYIGVRHTPIAPEYES